MKKYKVLFVSLNADFGQNGILQYDQHGRPTNESWEKASVYPAWKNIADQGLIELETHWVDQQSHTAGLDRLISIAKECDFVFQIPVTHALGIHLPQAHKIINNGTPIVSYHPDLHLRYKHNSGDRFVLSRIIEGYDTHTISPAKHMMAQLQNDGVKVYYIPFGVPAYSDYIPMDKIYDISFIGQKHGVREQVISQIRGAGLKVDVFGLFWPNHPNNHARPNYNEMNQIFNQTKINLNLRWCSRNPSHGQIKGRDTELLGAGAFMAASQHIESNDFHEMYTPGIDFIEEHYIHHLVEKIKYYLDNDTEREKIAAAAYQKRKLNTWDTRFKQFLESKFWHE